MNRQIFKDRHGTEYKLIKPNRVNWIVERVSDGRRMKGNASIFTFSHNIEEEAETFDPLLRVGAIVRLNADCPIVLDHRNSHTEGDYFIVLGFGDAPNEFKIIEAGGNPRNLFYKSVHARHLTVKK